MSRAVGHYRPPRCVFPVLAVLLFLGSPSSRTESRTCRFGAVLIPRRFRPSRWRRPRATQISPHRRAPALAGDRSQSDAEIPTAWHVCIRRRESPTATESLLRAVAVGRRKDARDRDEARRARRARAARDDGRRVLGGLWRRRYLHSRCTRLQSTGAGLPEIFLLGGKPVLRRPTLSHHRQRRGNRPVDASKVPPPLPDVLR